MLSSASNRLLTENLRISCPDITMKPSITGKKRLNRVKLPVVALSWLKIIPVTMYMMVATIAPCASLRRSCTVENLTTPRYVRNISDVMA